MTIPNNPVLQSLQNKIQALPQAQQFSVKVEAENTIKLFRIKLIRQTETQSPQPDYDSLWESICLIVRLISPDLKGQFTRFTVVVDFEEKIEWSNSSPIDKNGNIALSPKIKNQLLETDNQNKKQLLGFFSVLVGSSIVVFGYFFWIYKTYGVLPSFFQTSTSTTSAVQTQSSECTKASSYIWTNVRLYQDSSCTQPFATVYAGGQLQDGRKGVLLKFDSGATEWKVREAVTSQSYVKTDDPAIKAQLFRDMNQ